MSETLTPDLSTKAAENYEAAIEQMFSDMQKVNEKMGRDQEEIERLNAETREIIERLKAA
jgi:methyl-accepting chemotaxis protein